MNPTIAIIDRNTLNAIGLENLLSELFPTVDIDIFGSIDDFLSNCNKYYVHYFVSQSILLENTKEFDPLKKETVIMCEGEGIVFTNAGYKVIDITLPEKKLIGSIINLHQSGHKSHPVSKQENMTYALSPRENEVLALIVKGYYNKEIADILNLALTTVIFHRNNICNKLGTRSVGKLTLYAILSKLVDPGDL